MTGPEGNSECRFLRISMFTKSPSPEGNSEFCFLRISMLAKTKSRETLRFEGNKIHCSPRDQSLSDLLYSKTNGSNWSKKTC